MLGFCCCNYIVKCFSRDSSENTDADNNHKIIIFESDPNHTPNSIQFYSKTTLRVMLVTAMQDTESICTKAKHNVLQLCGPRHGTKLTFIWREQLFSFHIFCFSCISIIIMTLITSSENWETQSCFLTMTTSSKLQILLLSLKTN